MDFQSWIEKIDGMAGIYSFDIMDDGSFGEIRLMALNSKNTGVFAANPNAPEFYPGIPWRAYFTDLNFESFIYRAASTNNQLYSYVNAHGFWLKGFYLPLIINDDDTFPKRDGVRTVYCLYVGTISPEVEPEFMSQQSSAVSSAVMNISIKLHQTQNYHNDLASAVGELQKACASEYCMLYTVDMNKQHCNLIDENGVQKDLLNKIAESLGRTPYEVAQAWENDLADSDCLISEDLSIVKERDPIWYESLCKFDVKNIILYAVRYNHILVGFIWTVNFDTGKTMQIKETLELTSFLIGAVISNHQFVEQLEIMSKVDILTQVFNRNAFNERIEKLNSKASAKPDSLGIVYADLNGLKTVNDDEGHDAGDRLLSKSASLLKIAFGEYEIYRVGGDEFVILCPDITEEKLEHQVTQIKALAETTADVSFAVGNVFCNGNYNVSEAMQTADENMYKDKDEYYRLNPEKNRRRNSAE